MNTTQAINAILNKTQAFLNQVCRVTLKDGKVMYVYAWEACAGIAVRMYLHDVNGENNICLRVDHNNLTDYITHVGNEEIL